MPSDAITDKFGCRLEVGDWVLYAYTDSLSNVANLNYGQIKKIVSADNWAGGFSFVEFSNNETHVRPLRCVKFSQEEYTMRKLEAES